MDSGEGTREGRERAEGGRERERERERGRERELGLVKVGFEVD